MKRILMFSLGILCMIALMSFTFPNKKKKKIAAPPSMQYIPSGTMLEMNGEEKKETSIRGFYMAEIEVTNLFYKEFLADLEKNGRKEDLKIARVYHENWDGAVTEAYSKILKDKYFEHSAYDNYPVLNVSKKGAELYCQWLTEKWNEKTEKEKPKGMRNIEIEYRLPTQDEWKWAAKGGHELAPYPWGGYYVRNGKGQFLANFRRIGQNNIKYNRETKEYEIVQDIQKREYVDVSDMAHLTAPAYSFWPNDYGLYHMSGNVSEMLYDGTIKGGSWSSSGYYLQIDAENEFPNYKGEASPFIGFRPIAVIKQNSF